MTSLQRSHTQSKWWRTSPVTDSLKMALASGLNGDLEPCVRDGCASRTASKYRNTTTATHHVAALDAALPCSATNMVAAAGSSGRRGRRSIPGVTPTFAAVVAVNPQQRERHDLGDVLQRRDDPLAGLVWHRPVLRPTGGDVGHRQRVGVLTDCVASFMADQVDLHKPGRRVVPLCPGPDRDCVLEQRPRLGVAAPPQPHRSPVRRQAPVHRRRRHAHQRPGQLVADVELTEAPQRGHQLTHHRREPLTRRRPSTAQQNRNATTTSAPYVGDRGRRGRTTFGTRACPSALRAWMRCQPVVAHSSFRIALFSARLARLYRVAIVLVTACLWLIVSPITETYRQPVLQTGRRALRAHSLMSQRA